MYNIKDKYFERIVKKIEDGIFERGNDCRITHYYIEGDISRIPYAERTPEVCASLMDYGRCKLYEVPKSSRTREFYLATFTNEEVYNYIKNHIEEFDRQFFKDLLVTNEYATHFDRNCFEVMPLEYIDEEMCSLGIVESTGWANYSWFDSVFKRRPDAISEDVWKLAARLYTGCQSFTSGTLSHIPESYKDVDLYKQMCRCHYNYGIELRGDKQDVMDYIPKEVLTPKFLLGLLRENPNNFARFNEHALETEIRHTVDGESVKEKIWQFMIRENGELIRDIDLNDERVEFFLSNYSKDSSEYIFSFKDKYKKYKKQRDNKEDYERKQRELREESVDTAMRVLFGAMLYSMEGEDPSKAIEDESRFDSIKRKVVLPIKYRGPIPFEFIKEYDSEEYLEKLYKEMGIEIIDEHDNLFYNVVLPDGWKIENTDRYWNHVKDQNGNTVIEYFYDSKFYDRDAYVKDVNPVKGKELKKK